MAATILKLRRHARLWPSGLLKMTAQPVGVDPWVDTGHFPLLFEVKKTPCVLSPYFFVGKHFLY